jgi:hypothetical protein
MAESIDEAIAAIAGRRAEARRLKAILNARRAA